MLHEFKNLNVQPTHIWDCTILKSGISQRTFLTMAKIQKCIVLSMLQKGVGWKTIRILINQLPLHLAEAFYLGISEFNDEAGNFNNWALTIQRWSSSILKLLWEIPENTCRSKWKCMNENCIPSHEWK